MRIIVLMKQVPDTTDVKIDPKTGRLIREGVPSIMNPEDKNALEEALRIKEKKNAEIIAVTMGPMQAEDILREALALGADDAILLNDIKFAGSDTWATANALSAAIKTIGKFDLILCGRQAIDGDTAQVGPQLAENLNLPQITYVQKLEISDKIVAQRQLEDGYEVIEARMPALITCIKDINKPRYPHLRGILEAYNKKIKIWKADDVKADENSVGLNASPTAVKKITSPEPKGRGIILEGNAKEVAKKLIDRLKEKEIIQEF